jgi:pyrroline-5-carboxylate reductase
VVDGIAGDGHDIIVSERSATHAARLAGAYDNVRVGENADVVAGSDILFLGLMADAAADILCNLPFRADQRVVTFMAGASLEQVATWVAPAKVEALMLPFPAIARGGSAVLCQPESDLLDQIFGAKNTLFAVENDAQMQAYLSAQAVLSPSLKLLDEAANWLGTRVDRDQGEAFLRALVGSALSAPLSDTIAALSTPGGYNAQLRDHMMAAGMGDALAEGLNQLEARAKSE